jgi:hypothetical protein
MHFADAHSSLSKALICDNNQENSISEIYRLKTKLVEIDPASSHLDGTTIWLRHARIAETQQAKAGSIA